ncbi:hypothetical protein GBN24_13690 [Plesiomonas shigelloides]|uniref:hypothetical protein n=1 Tax=Plesiomonas shigelloides TaxID=703 RepID=UPI0012629C7D|nr:hypothetical protein [Plesiomonas shigelloides]KAB7687911.1 hypothetical protein GBN24_13690 [Plesiomonas shigelloides]
MTKKRKKGMSLATKIKQRATALIQRNISNRSIIKKDRKGRLITPKKGINGAGWLSTLRDKSHHESLHELKNTLTNKELRNSIIPYAFPKDVEIKESVRYKSSPHGLFYDIDFETIILNSFSEEIKHFLELKNEFECFLIKNQLAEASETLKVIFDRFGYSNWFISSKLNLIIESDNSTRFLEYHKEITSAFKENQFNNLSEVHLSYPFIRCDKGVSFERYKFAIQHQSEEFKISRNNIAIEQIHFSNCYSPEKNFKYLSKIICENSSNNIIDRYLNFRRIVISCQLHNRLHEFNFSNIKELYSNINDSTLRNVLYANKVIDFKLDENDGKIAKAGELYFKSQYSDAASLCEMILDENPLSTSIIEIYVKSLIRCGLRPEKTSLLNNIINKIIDLYTKPHKSELVKLLMKDFLRLYHCDWAFFIKLQCEKFTVTSESDPSEYLYSFLDFHTSLANLFGNESIDIKSDNKEITYRKILSLNDDEIKNDTLIDKGRKLKTLGDKYFQKKEYSIAYQYYNELANTADPLYGEHALSRQAMCLFKDGHIDKAFNHVANLIKTSSNAIYSCLKEFSEFIIDSNNSGINLTHLMDRVIILNTFNNLNNNEYSYILTLMCEDILDQLNISCAEDIYIDVNNSYFFENVLNKDIMETFDIFENNKEILLFRMVTLQKLVIFDNECDEKIDILRAEMFSTLEKLAKENCVTDCGSGRIEVDTISVKKNAVSKFSDDFEAIKKSEKIPFKKSDYTEITKNSESFNYSSNNYYSKVLDLFYKVRDEYTISPLYGLDNFLNLNIRHGGVINLLLGPIKAHKLFYLKNDKGIYERENYWFEQYVYLSKTNRELIDDAFRRFSKCFDKEVQAAKGWIHINTGEFNEGEKVFNFFSDSGVIEKLGEHINEQSNFEDFVNLIVDYLISQTNNALKILKTKVDTVLRKNINICFDTLSNDINNISRLDELKRKIKLSQREANEKINELISWLDWKNETNNPFLIGSSFDAALDVTNSLHPNVNLKTNYSDDTYITIKGDYFRRFVTIFLILIENSINHSCIKDTITIKISVTNKDPDEILIKFSNVVSLEALLRSKDKIEKLKPLINSNYIIGANGESGSGLYKIKKLFSYDMRVKNQLDIYLDFDDKSFNLSVNLIRAQIDATQDITG